MLNTKEEIENWLNEYEIANFIINDDLSVDINGDVKLEDKEIEEFPFQFGVIKGNFDCSYNCLISLKNAPKEINGSFDCSSNYLKNLKYCPEKITGDFYCCNNKLVSLKNAPKKVKGNFYCHNNKLISLEYSPKEINGNFYCSINNLTSLEYSPKKVGGDFDCSHNKLTSLEYCPKEINGSFDCSRNELNKESLHLFNSNIKDDIKSDFAFGGEFVILVKEQKAYYEKTEINKNILPEVNSSLMKKRL